MVGRKASDLLARTLACKSEAGPAIECPLFEQFDGLDWLCCDPGQLDCCKADSR